MDVGSTITLGFLSIIILLWYIWRKKRMTIFERLGIPGPKPHFITGNVKNSSQQADLSLQWEKKYGKIYGIYMGACPFLVVSDVELLKHVQIKDFKKFLARTKSLTDLAFSQPVIHEGMFSKTGDEWKNARSAISPAFTTGKLKKMIPSAVEAIDIFLEKIAQQNGQTFDIAPLIRKLSFDINCRASFGIATAVQNNDESKFIRSVYRSFDADSNDFLAKMIIYFPELGSFPQILRMIRDKFRDAFDSPSALSVIEGCKRIINARKENPQASRPDLLQALLDSAREPSKNNEGKFSHVPLTESEVVGNAFGFMLAGFDAIAVMLQFLTHHLVEHPKIQDKLRDEIKTHVKGKVDYDSLSKLIYLDQIISEVLRLFPFSVTGINRTATEEFKYNGITIPKGMNIAIALHALNMDPNFWEKPEEFNPDRFSPENGEINNMVYQPFGTGPRNCIGMRFAQVVMKAIAASLFQNYRIYKPPDAKDFEMEYTVFFVRPKNGVQIQASPV